MRVSPPGALEPAKLRSGAAVWVAVAKQGFRPATFQQLAGGKAHVVLCEEDKLESVDPRRLRPRDAAEQSCADCVALRHLDEANLLENLCRRFAKDEIYSYVGSVLLAVNPFRELELCKGREVLQSHLESLLPRWVARANRPPPHPYALAAAALRGARRGEKQAIIVSGESGAGKTETARLVLRFLEASRVVDARQPEAPSEGPLLCADRVLESLGHAATPRNANSSRFGKCLKLRPSGGAVAAQLEVYLLEASRAAARSPGERSFHIFHEIVAQRTQLPELGLLESHELLKGCPKGAAAEGPGSERGLREFGEALKGLELQGAEKPLLGCYAGLLHLGDVLSSAEACGEFQFSESSLEQASQLLGMDAGLLRGSLRFRRVRDCEPVERTRSQVQCMLRSLVVTIYGRLFRSVVKLVNEALANRCRQDPKGADFLLLDIYGFENLTKNSLEQLLINLSNERLQQFFLDQVVSEQQQLHVQEGLPYCQVHVAGRQQVVKAIATVLDTLDDAGKLMGGRSAGAHWLPETKLQEVAAQSAGSVARRKGGLARGAFTVAHYAGAVEYDSEAWQERNDAKPLPEVEALMASSKHPIISKLARTAPAGQQLRSVSREHRADLDKLMAALKPCVLHFVRCFRPNRQGSPGRLDRAYLLEQLLGCGTLELLQVMQQSYPHRLDLQEVSKRLAPLLPGDLCKCSNTRTAVQTLMLAYGVPKGQWALGVSQLFLKAGQLGALEDLRDEAWRPSAAQVAAAKSKVLRGRWRHAVLAVTVSIWLLRDQRRRAERRASLQRRLRGAAWAVAFLVAVRRRAVETRRRTDELAAAEALARAEVEMQDCQQVPATHLARPLPSPSRGDLASSSGLVQKEFGAGRQKRRRSARILLHGTEEEVEGLEQQRKRMRT